MADLKKKKRERRNSAMHLQELCERENFHLITWEEQQGQYRTKKMAGISPPRYLMLRSALRSERERESTVKVLCGLLKTEQALSRIICPASELLRQQGTHFSNFPGSARKTPRLKSTLVIV